MAKLRPDVEWAPADPRAWRRMGMRERVDGRWDVVTAAHYWNGDESELVMVVDSRDAAIGFIKLLKEK